MYYKRAKGHVNKNNHGERIGVSRHLTREECGGIIQSEVKNGGKNFPMSSFKESYRNLSRILTAFAIVGLICALFFIGAASGDPCLGGLAFALMGSVCLIFTFIFALVNVVLSLVALNRKDFQNREDKKFARIVFWVNVLIIPAVFLLPMLIVYIADAIDDTDEVYYRMRGYR